MFQEFMGSIKEMYDDVGNFFDDLLTKDTLSDIIKSTAETTKKESSTSSKSDSPMLDFEELKIKDPLLADLEEEFQKKKTPKAVDYRTINDEWIQRLKGIATNNPYYKQEEDEYQ
jgi:hypothetical protein